MDCPLLLILSILLHHHHHVHCLPQAEDSQGQVCLCTSPVLTCPQLSLAGENRAATPSGITKITGPSTWATRRLANPSGFPGTPTDEVTSCPPFQSPLPHPHSQLGLRPFPLRRALFMLPPPHQPTKLGLCLHAQLSRLVTLEGQSVPLPKGEPSTRALDPPSPIHTRTS